MKRLISVMLALLMISVLFASCGKKIVKTVGKYEADSDLDAFFKGDDEKLAAFFAPYALADEYGFDYDSKDFELKCEAEKERVIAEDYGGDREKLASELKEVGMTEEVFDKVNEQFVLSENLFEFLKEKDVFETDEEALKKAFSEGEVIRVKRILIEYGKDDAEKAASKDTIENAKADIDDGIPFEDIMKEFRDGGIMLGDMGEYEDSFFVIRGDTVDKTYEEKAFSLDVGEVAGPFDTTAGHCILKRYELTPEILDDMFDTLASRYTEGQYNLLIDSAAEKLAKEIKDK